MQSSRQRDGTASASLIGPAEPPDISREGAVIEVAQQAGVRRIVKQSAMAAHDMSACTFKRWNGVIERQLMQSGLAYTILRPTGFPSVDGSDPLKHDAQGAQFERAVAGHLR